MNTPGASERAIDHALARWVRERTGSDLLARAAFAASRAEGQGHACAALADDPAFNEGDFAALRAHSWVGDGTAPAPFVFEENAHFYTLRNWRHESRLAANLRDRAWQRTLPVDAAELLADVAELFGDEDAAATRWQRAAVAAAPGSRIFVLTGGPGTGKTTTVVRLLLLLLRRARACGLPATPSIALAAPTGKAAQRLAQAVAAGKQQLLGELDPGSAFRGLLGKIPHGEASTLHRLLGFRPSENDFARGAGDPLAADIVVVDEASMVDLAMMRQLVDALSAQTMLILLGDPGQLAAVEAGSVLSDIVTSVAGNTLPAPLAQRLAAVLDPPPASTDDGAPLTGQVITLTHVWRAGGDLHRGLQALRTGDATWVDALLVGAGEGNLRWHDCADAAALRKRVDVWLSQHSAPFSGLMQPGVEPAAALTQLRGAQILCALREGEFGARDINAVIARRLGERFGFDARQLWYHGRPVLISHNDYARGLYNGDIGIALEGEDGLRVWFEVGARDGGIGLRSFSPRALPAHETAWAITIHRSQGSEYANVAVVLPPQADHRILSRELLYTAVSRATRGAEIWTTAAALRSAVAQPIRRIGGLRERLR